ncbi:MAG: carotenoid biosynthesis protein [Salinirussus sp.]
METTDRYDVGNLVVTAAAFGHALSTWPALATGVLFLAGMALAFLAEAAVVRLGLLRHEIQPQVFGVPISVVLVWPAIVYVCLRIALLLGPSGLGAALLAAVMGVVANVIMDPLGVAEGVWAYPEHPVSRPRFRGVPWWSFAGWLVIVTITAMVPLTVGL